MYLKKAHIENFRGIRTLTIDFSENNTMLIGENHWGKTSLLRALWMLLGNGENLCKFESSDLYVPIPLQDEIDDTDLNPLTHQVLKARNKKNNKNKISSNSKISYEEHFEITPDNSTNDFLEEVKEVISKPNGFRKESIDVPNNKKIVIDLWFQESLIQTQADRDPIFKNFSYYDDDNYFLIHWRAEGYFDKQKHFVTEHNLVTRQDKLYPKSNLTIEAIYKLIRFNPVFRLRDRRMEQDFKTTDNNLQNVMLTDMISSDPSIVDLDVKSLVSAFGSFMDKYITSYAQDDNKNKDSSYSRNIDEIVKRPISLESLASIRNTLSQPGINQAKVLASFILMSFVLSKGNRDFDSMAKPIIILEDIDSRFHPTLLLSFFSLLENTQTQRIVTTNSGDLLSATSLDSLRRLQKLRYDTQCYKIQTASFKEEELRKIAFHIRINRPMTLFARTWILVEGETEVWVLTQIASMLGISLACEGIRIIEFAQCGLPPLMKIAHQLGINVHVLTDGDDAGKNYAQSVQNYFKKNVDEHLTVLPQKDIEHYLFAQGYINSFKTICKIPLSGPLPKGMSMDKVISMAIKRKSKPGLALYLVEEIQRKGIKGIPIAFAQLLDKVRNLSKGEYL